MKRQIEAVVFDVGRVLFQWQLRHLFEKMVDNPARLEKLLGEVVTEEWHYLHDAGQPLAEMVPKRIAQFPDFADEIQAYATRFNDTIPGPVPGTHALLERLHAREIPLFAVTNFGAEFWAGFRPTEAIFDRFHDIVVSGEECIAKPDPAIFAIAQRRFGHAPEAMLFIDDNFDNVASAERCGWNGHHFIDAARLEADLVERGLL